MAVCPLLAASLLVYRESGTAGARALLQRAVDSQRITAKVWFVPILLLPPGIMAVSFSLIRLLGWLPFGPQVSALALPVLVLGFLLFALTEEVGWTGYATDPLLARMPALTASVLLGLVWAVWHLVPLLQAQRAAGWITAIVAVAWGPETLARFGKSEPAPGISRPHDSS